MFTNKGGFFVNLQITIFMEILQIYELINKYNVSKIIKCKICYCVLFLKNFKAIRIFLIYKKSLNID